MYGQDSVGDDMADRRNKGNSSLSPFHVDSRIGKSCERVAHEWRQENQRDCGIAKVVIFFQLNMLVIYLELAVNSHMQPTYGIKAYELLSIRSSRMM